MSSGSKTFGTSDGGYNLQLGFQCETSVSQSPDVLRLSDGDFLFSSLDRSGYPPLPVTDTANQEATHPAKAWALYDQTEV